ncbi:MAG: 2-C-methyl-D-erythritol 4-phosphate cytidylyltransferase [Elusimicrobia bacterium]|nr:2-C-methyl-D-erythritol 4-phosphate cytidylyltransferase [Elusimicrobiota bacterium]
MRHARGEKTCAAVIAAAGCGVRMGGPKQRLELCGKPLLLRAAEAFRKVPRIGHIIAVSDAETFRLLGRELDALGVLRAKAGSTRLESVRNGIKALPDGVELVAVHDGARPLVSPELIENCLAAAQKHGAAVPAVPVKDTLKESSGAFVENTPDRARYWAAQTPQCYRREVLEKALKNAPRGCAATDESTLVEKTGRKVALVRGSYDNFKITTPEDLLLAEAIMAKKTGKNEKGEMRVGIGYDIHRMVPGKPLYIGGARIPHTKGMLGHSDGDALLHAVCDAMLGAVSAGEIGIYFPPTDLTIMGISSREIAAKTLEIMKENKAELRQIDAVIVAESPKLMIHYNTIRRSLSEIFGLELNRISVKAKSHEGMGELGRGEAMSCQVVVMVKLK